MIIDCGRCTVRGVACAHCAVTFVADPTAPSADATAPVADATVTETAPARRRAPAPGNGRSSRVIELDAAEMRALAALANAGMIPPLRYAPPMAKAS